MLRHILSARSSSALVAFSVLALAFVGAAQALISRNPPLRHVAYPYKGVIVVSSSMEPTVHCRRGGMDDGCRGKVADVAVEQLSGAKGIRRGDIVSFPLPAAAGSSCASAGGNKLWEKRVIAAAGDRVRERDGFISVDGRRLNEPYISPGHRGHHSGSWTVPANAVFVAGDNRAISCDSRYWGPIPTSSIVGKIVEIIRRDDDTNANRSPPVVHVDYPYEADQIRLPVMEPSLHCARPKPYCEGRFPDLVLVARSGAKGIRRGDIITFRLPPSAAKFCGTGRALERVIGLPGERLVERWGTFYVNGHRLGESYIAQRYRDHMSGHWVVPSGSYFVIDDLRKYSCDSRYWGSVPAARIEGRIVEIFRPPT